MCINVLISYFRMVDFTEEKSIAYASVITQQINTTFDVYFKNVDKLSYQIAYSDNVHEWLTSNYNSSNPIYEYGMDTAAAYRFLDGMRKTAHGIDSVSVYNNDGRGYYGFSTGPINTNYKIKDENWYKKVESSDGEKVFVGPYEDKQIDISNRTVISLVRKIKDLNTFKGIGTIVIEVNMNDMFANHLKYIGQDTGSNIFILDEDGKIIYNNVNENKVNTGFDSKIFSKMNNNKFGSIQEKFDGEAALITFYTSSFTNWKVVNVTS